MGEVEQLFNNYLAVDGEQKVYVLPTDLQVDQILGGLTGIRTGEVKQSQMWRKTDITIGQKEQGEMIGSMRARFQEMDERISRLEFSLNQLVEQDSKTRDGKSK
jgi:TolA-binding protein